MMKSINSKKAVILNVFRIVAFFIATKNERKRIPIELRKGMILLIAFLENIYELSIAVLLLCSFFHVSQMNKLKRERKFTAFEFVMYIVTQVAIIVWIASFLLVNEIILFK